MLMLMALRHGITGHSAVLEGRQMQMKEAVMASNSPELGEQAVGLVGLGDIGQAVARLLKPFGCRLYYYTLHRRPPEVEAELGVTYLPLEELFSACDILSLHCAVNDQTRGMVNEALLERVKPGAILVNTARGDLVDNLAVRRALIQGRLGGIATPWPPSPPPPTTPWWTCRRRSRTGLSTPPTWEGIPAAPSAGATGICGRTPAASRRDSGRSTSSTACKN